MLSILHFGCLIVFTTDTMNLCHLYHLMLNGNKHYLCENMEIEWLQWQV